MPTACGATVSYTHLGFADIDAIDRCGTMGHHKNRAAAVAAASVETTFASEDLRRIEIVSLETDGEGLNKFPHLALAV